MKLSAADIQVLTAICAQAEHRAATTRERLEDYGRCYGDFKQDWSASWSRLQRAKLILCKNDCYELTGLGLGLARHFFPQRANASYYHYERFYPIANASTAHSEFCERVYGRDLCQDGQTDMVCFDAVIDSLNLSNGDTALEIGCGSGGMAEYLSDRTSAHVVGLDIAESAIATAVDRTCRKREALSFIQADMNSVQLPAAQFDAIYAIDSLGWMQSPSIGLPRLARSLKPGGRLCIVSEQRVPAVQSPEAFNVQQTPLFAALSTLGRSCSVENLSAELPSIWTRAIAQAKALQAEFARDGAAFICSSWIRAAQETYLPAIAACRLHRYRFNVVI